MADDYFRYYLSHVKAKRVTCQPFSNMKIKTVLHPNKKDMLHSAVKSQLLDNLEQGTNTKFEQPNADNVIRDYTTLINV